MLAGSKAAHKRRIDLGWALDHAPTDFERAINDLDQQRRIALSQSARLAIT